MKDNRLSEYLKNGGLKHIAAIVIIGLLTGDLVLSAKREVSADVIVSVEQLTEQEDERGRELREALTDMAHSIRIMADMQVKYLEGQESQSNVVNKVYHEVVEVRKTMDDAANKMEDYRMRRVP